jgi:hypothetical protein
MIAGGLTLAARSPDGVQTRQTVIRRPIPGLDQRFHTIEIEPGDAVYVRPDD